MQQQTTVDAKSSLRYSKLATRAIEPNNSKTWWIRRTGRAAELVGMKLAVREVRLGLRPVHLPEVRSTGLDTSQWSHPSAGLYMLAHKVRKPVGHTRRG